jgi:hypothetical protein
MNYKPSKFSVKQMSFFIILLGFVLGYFFIYRKIEIMKQGQDLYYSYKVIALVPMCISMGLYFMIFRINNDGHFKNLSPKDKRTFVIAMVFMALSVIATIVWFNGQLAKYGYN